jgi:hypothetical protein
MVTAFLICLLPKLSLAIIPLNLILNKMKIRVTVLLFLSVLASDAFAQETEVKKCDLSIGADFASMYLWRGIALGTAPAVQPWGEFSYKGLTLGAWGSYEFTG